MAATYSLSLLLSIIFDFGCSLIKIKKSDRIERLVFQNQRLMVLLCLTRRYWRQPKQKASGYG